MPGAPSTGSSPRTRECPRTCGRPCSPGCSGRTSPSWGSTSARRSCSSGDGWFFVIQEQATEARFGFDELDGPGPPPTLDSWSKATWEHTGTAPGAYLRIAGNPLEGTSLDDVRFVDHAAHLAALTHQQPMRVAIHAGGVPELVVP